MSSFLLPNEKSTLRGNDKSHSKNMKCISQWIQEFMWLANDINSNKEIK